MNNLLSEFWWYVYKFFNIALNILREEEWRFFIIGLCLGICIGILFLTIILSVSQKMDNIMNVIRTDNLPYIMEDERLQEI